MSWSRASRGMRSLAFAGVLDQVSIRRSLRSAGHLLHSWKLNPVHRFSQALKTAASDTGSRTLPLGGPVEAAMTRDASTSPPASPEEEQGQRVQTEVRQLFCTSESKAGFGVESFAFESQHPPPGGWGGALVLATGATEVPASLRFPGRQSCRQESLPQPLPLGALAPGPAFLPFFLCFLKRKLMLNCKVAQRFQLF